MIEGAKKKNLNSFFLHADTENQNQMNTIHLANQFVLAFTLG